MKKIITFILKALGIIAGLGTVVFGAVQTVYWLNLDNKLMFLIYKVLEKHYEKIPRDRKF